MSPLFTFNFCKENSVGKRYRLHNPDANKRYNHPIFNVVCKLIGKAMGDLELIGEENIPDEPCIIVPNHAGAYGPMSVLAYYDRPNRPFVISNMCKLREAPAFARKDFFDPKGPVGRAVAFLASFPIALILQGVFKGAEAIPSYFDHRAMVTLAKANAALEEGLDLIVFPEERVYYSPYVEQYQRGFISIARKHHHATKKCIKFVPAFTSASRKKMEFGKPIQYDPSKKFKDHSEEIRLYLQKTANDLAQKLGSDAEYFEETYKSKDSAE